MSYTYQQEFFRAIRKSEYEGLIAAHWHEIALNKSKIELKPDYERYNILCETGVLKVFTCRHNGELVGYFACFVMPHLHYADDLFATNDVIFIAKNHRKGFVGIRLIKFAEKCLKEDGVSVLQINTKTHQSFHPVLERLGYKATDVVYGKLLKG